MILYAGILSKFDRSSLKVRFSSSTFAPSSKTLPPPSFIILKPHLNYRYLRDNLDSISQNIRNRNVLDANIQKVAQLYANFGEITKEINDLRSKRNEIANLTKKLSSSFSLTLSDERAALLEQGKMLKELIHQRDARLGEIEQLLLQEALLIPNETHPDAPIGDASQTRVVKQFGTPLTQELVSYPIKDHLSIAKKHDLLDLESAAKVSGNSWYYLRNAGALLELALIQYAMQKLISKGFTPIITPDVIRTEFSNACGFNPRTNEMQQNYFLSTSSHSPDSSSLSKEQQHQQQKSTHLILSATAEIPLAGIYAEKILKESQLPIKMVGFGRAYRAEAGARGADTKGLYRVHQFSKVEIFSVTTPEQSERMFDEIISIQEEICVDLGLCFKVLDMPTGELGASAFRKYDIEAWMAGRGDWGEISSASNCTDYQSRRLNIRYRPSSRNNNEEKLADQKSSSMPQTEFVHTLNGTAAAVPRLIIAILENFQTSDGKVLVPKVLQKWMGGLKVIGDDQTSQ
ncbi:hypothetical protein G9A89_008700 [Geosiphon pyriformis]|nr:hypothetical protein G9A89_008700 [Geosiphon pyriformis]